MEVAQPEILGIVDYHGVRIGDIQTVFHNRGGNQHIDLSLQELHQDVFHLLAVHLAMGHGDAGIGCQPLHKTGHLGQVLHTVADKKVCPPRDIS